MYRGVRFRRTPEQLDLPPEDWTAERSRSAWLAWLRTAIKHFDLTGEVLPLPKKVKKAPRSKSRFVPWRDDPEYPNSGWGGNRGLHQVREYVTKHNDILRAASPILDELRTESKSGEEFQEYLQMKDVVCGDCKTLDELRYSNKVAFEILRCAKTLNEIRRYAKTLSEIQKVLAEAVMLRRSVQESDELREYGVVLNELLEVARTLGGIEPPPSYRGWEGPPRYRWSKMYKGVRLRVTCEQLGLPKEHWNAKDSHHAWLTWLQKAIQAVNRPST